MDLHDYDNCARISENYEREVHSSPYMTKSLVISL